MVFLDGPYEYDCISRLMRKIFDHVFTSKNASNKLIEENRGKYAWIFGAKYVGSSRGEMCSTLTKWPAESSVELIRQSNKILSTDIFWKYQCYIVILYKQPIKKRKFLFFPLNLVFRQILFIPKIRDTKKGNMKWLTIFSVASTNETVIWSFFVPYAVIRNSWRVDSHN